MFANFNRFKKVINIVGKPSEKAVLTRQGKSSVSNFKSNFVYIALLEECSHLQKGDVFSTEIGGEMKVFLVITVRKADMSLQAVVYECNGVAEVYRPRKIFDAADNLVETKLEFVDAIATNHMTVSGYMRMLDAGLLPSTTKEFRMPKCDIQLMDRIVLDGEKFCVDFIDKTKFDGLLAVQTSNDNRSF